MEIEDVLRKRASCRIFTVGPDLPLSRLLEIENAGRSAPYASGGPRREFCYWVNASDKLKTDISEACFGQVWVRYATEAILVCGKDPGAMLRSGHPKYIFDCSAACMCMDLMAVSMGYGTCWIGHFDPNAIREAYNLDKTLIPTIILLVGERAEP